MENISIVRHKRTDLKNTSGERVIEMTEKNSELNSLEIPLQVILKMLVFISSHQCYCSDNSAHLSV